MLLDDIIAILTDQNGSLEAALLKTKVFLRSIGHKDLTTWVNNELTGYPDDVEVPTYRIAATVPHGYLNSLRMEVKDTLLPTGHMTPMMQKNVSEIRISSSIGTIENQVKQYRENKLGLVRQLPPEYLPAFQKGLDNAYVLMTAWCTINMADVEAILVSVRSRLLDFCLELQEQLGDVEEPKELKAKADSANAAAMFYTFVYGGNNTFGVHNIQVNNQKDDLEGLIAEFAKIGIEKPMLDDLRKAVVEDQKEGKKPNIGEGKTQHWFLNACKEGGKAVVKTGVDLLASTAVKALQAYAGTG
jgi:AbiTii